MPLPGFSTAATTSSPGTPPQRLIAMATIGTRSPGWPWFLIIGGRKRPSRRTFDSTEPFIMKSLSRAAGAPGAAPSEPARAAAVAASSTTPSRQTM